MREGSDQSNNAGSIDLNKENGSRLDSPQSSSIIEQLERKGSLSKAEYIQLLQDDSASTAELIFEKARRIRNQHYSNHIYVRGLIETTNYCQNDCFYCGIRRSNRQVVRYRLSGEEILGCCHRGYEMGFRTFVLQGGEDPAWTDEKVAKLVAAIKHRYPDCAVTLSLGERKKESYQLYYEAGADRYLLRHETANDSHYRMLHPPELSLEHRRQCLWNLKEIGFQVGTGMMVGSPGQTPECLADDFMFIQELQPHMVGIGPFISHKDTPFHDALNGTLMQTLRILGILRIMLPKALLPATTALATIDPIGREKGILAGANVIMPNLTPREARKNYMLYDNKKSTGLENAEGLIELKKSMSEMGYEIVVSRGDYAGFCVN